MDHIRHFSREIPDLIASIGLTGMGILNALQIIQAGLGVILTALGIYSTYLIIRRNKSRKDEIAV